MAQAKRISCGFSEVLVLCDFAVNLGNQVFLLSIRCLLFVKRPILELSVDVARVRRVKHRKLALQVLSHLNCLLLSSTGIEFVLNCDENFLTLIVTLEFLHSARLFGNQLFSVCKKVLFLGFKKFFIRLSHFKVFFLHSEDGFFILENAQNFLLGLKSSGVHSRPDSRQVRKGNALFEHFVNGCKLHFRSNKPVFES